MVDAIIIGGGLFGSIIAKELQAKGREVVIIDCDKPDAGSKPAACLMKPSWFSSLGKEISEPSLELLDRHYGVKDIKFKLPNRFHATVHWVDPQLVLDKDYIAGEVYAITPEYGFGHLVSFRTKGSDKHLQLEAPLVVVAAGVWSADIVPIEGGLQGQAGMAFLWPENTIEDPFVSPWAPYRQLVAFNRGDGLWVGDGTAIKHENWTEDRALTSLARCGKAVNLSTPPKKLYGIRPYTKRKPCYLEEVSPGLWAATGGAKNGTIAAGWCAHEIARRTA